MSAITLTAWKDGGWHRFPVTFADAAQALAWRARKEPQGIYLEDDEDHQVTPPGRIGPWTLAELELYRALHPTCHHGLALDLCMDPVGQNHWGTYEQERMAAGY